MTGVAALNDKARIRTRVTRSSDEAWQVGHAAALPLLASALPIAVATVVLAVVLVLMAGGMWGFAVTAAGFLVEMAIILRSAWLADRAARQVGA